MSAPPDSPDGAYLDPALVERTAGALGVDEAFVEKDWHVVRILHALGELTYEDCKLVFGGGTSLSKAYGLIKRFSEDIDFRATPSTTVCTLSEGKRRSFRKAVERAIESIGYHIDEDRTERRNGNRMFTLYVPFTPSFSHSTLRTDVKMEVTLEGPWLPAKSAPVGSFVGRFQGAPPEVAAITCVDPVETAADKLAALSWRVFEHRNLPDTATPPGKARDRSLVRHVHDLCALEHSVVDDERFKPLLIDLFDRDGQRGKDTRDERPTDPSELAKRMCEVLLAPPFPDDYRQFVRNVVYGHPIPDYENAIDALRRLATYLTQP
ncbi:nucleotidyl transferase AbiEii/AbiGii toxin family protein [Arenibaculum sp.]|uniref:nucleotidyl transferase AbiEii/AbiGii toxin family protein n=1 Tax=Arenibaculum sp. TaxID=2865862 RepID=UPI002E0D46E7|nr:nucleotidyl transferase AbiEii/AbiGii toxin family protein [Arenibaculum sp.]